MRYKHIESNEKDKKLPETIYKYYTCNKNFFRSLMADEMFFANPETFNDPYEPVLAALKGGVFDKGFNNGFNIDPPEIKILRNALVKSAISCFSKDNDNFTLWSYYADGLKGVCLGFNTYSLLNDVKNSTKSKGNSDILNSFYVDYVGCSYKGIVKIPQVDTDLLEKFDPQEMIKAFATKSHIFEPEHEIRLVQNAIQQKGTTDGLQSKQGLYKYNRDSISEIIFGEKSSEAQKEAIRNFLKKPEIYKDAKFSKNEYRIEVL